MWLAIITVVICAAASIALGVLLAAHFIGKVIDKILNDL
jgi:uncharacterized protein YneF (UPF0154 family)